MPQMHRVEDFFAGSSAASEFDPGSPTDTGTSVTPTPASPPATGIFGEIKDKAKQIIHGASTACSRLLSADCLLISPGCLSAIFWSLLGKQAGYLADADCCD